MTERDAEIAEQCYEHDQSWTGVGQRIFNKEKFADLVRADMREACVKVCEEVGEHPSLTPRHCVDAIRAMGNL